VTTRNNITHNSVLVATRLLIKRIQDKIEESRGDRTALRDSIYDGIEVNGYDQVLTLYYNMRLSRELMESEVRKRTSGKVNYVGLNYWIIYFRSDRTLGII
jgi:hypothetical protein